MTDGPGRPSPAERLAQLHRLSPAARLAELKTRRTTPPPTGPLLRNAPSFLTAPGSHAPANADALGDETVNAAAGNFGLAAEPPPVEAGQARRVRVQLGAEAPRASDRLAATAESAQSPALGVAADIVRGTENFGRGAVETVAQGTKGVLALGREALKPGPPLLVPSRGGQPALGADSPSMATAVAPVVQPIVAHTLTPGIEAMQRLQEHQQPDPGLAATAGRMAGSLPFYVAAGPAEGAISEAAGLTGKALEGSLVKRLAHSAIQGTIGNAAQATALTAGGDVTPEQGLEMAAQGPLYGLGFGVAGEALGAGMRALEAPARHAAANAEMLNRVGQETERSVSEALAARRAAAQMATDRGNATAGLLVVEPTVTTPPVRPPESPPVPPELQGLPLVGEGPVGLPVVGGRPIGVGETPRPRPDLSTPDPTVLTARSDIPLEKQPSLSTPGQIGKALRERQRAAGATEAPVEAPAPVEGTPITRALVERRTAERPELSRAEAAQRIREARNQLQRRYEIDPLTKLPNGRALERALPAAEADPHTVVVQVDARGLKWVNDNHGMPAGDTYLRTVGEEGLRAGRETGAGERIFRPHEGGDEYVALVPHDKAEAFTQRWNELSDRGLLGGKYPSGVRTGIGATNAEALTAIEDAKKAETIRYRETVEKPPAPETVTPLPPAPTPRAGRAPSQLEGVWRKKSLTEIEKAQAADRWELGQAQARGDMTAIEAIQHRLRALNGAAEFRKNAGPVLEHTPPEAGSITPKTVRGKTVYEGGRPAYRALANEDLVKLHRQAKERMTYWNEREGGQNTRQNKGQPGRAVAYRNAALDNVNRIEEELVGRGYDPSHLFHGGELRESQGQPLGHGESSEADLPPDTGGFNPDEFGEAGTTKLKVLAPLAGGLAGGAAGAASAQPGHRKEGFAEGFLGGALAAHLVTGGRVAKSLEEIFSPSTVSGHADAMAGLLRDMRGTTDRARVVRAQAGEVFRKQLQRLPVEERNAFMDRIERGEAQPPALRRAAEFYRKTLDAKSAEIAAVAPGAIEEFERHYFPRAWERPEEAEAVVRRVQRRKSLTGSKSFLKEREFDFASEARAAGLKPISDNPADIWAIKMNEMDRFIHGTRMVKELKNRGLARAFGPSEVPPGWAEIEDVALGSPGSVKTVGRGGKVTRQPRRWYAPEDAARVLNNALGKGFRGHPLYDALATVNNSINAANLGFSAFHLTAEAFNGIASEVGIGLTAAKRGAIREALTAVPRAVASPVTSMVEGSKLLREWSQPGSVGGRYAEMAQRAMEAGGKFGQEHSAIDQLVQAWRKKEAGGVIRNGLLAPFEVAGAPIMRLAVPRMKAAAFMRLMESELARLGPEATDAAVQAAQRRAWDSIDNRFGQMVLDNRFWDPHVRDLASLATRSVGWNVGTLDELGGGVLDMTRGKMTPRAQYTIALPVTAAALGGMTMYLMTGHWPQHLKDYFDIPTGETTAEGDQERVNLPTYMKDVVSYSRHPLSTVAHKASPLLSAALMMLQNKDYFGNKIVNPDDPTGTKFQQALRFLAKSSEPFALTNAQEAKRRGNSSAASYFGVTPAKREDVRTPAENRMVELLSRRGAAELTPEQVEAADQRRQMQGQLRGDRSAGTAAVREAVGAGRLTPRQALGMLKNSLQAPDDLRFKRLTLEEATQVYRLAAPEERAAWWPLLARKAQSSAQAKDRQAVEDFLASGVRELPRTAEPQGAPR